LPGVRALLAEAAGTFVLVFAGTGSIIADERGGDGELGHLGVSLAFGLAIAAGVFVTRRASGAHFNPAISVAMSSLGRFPLNGVPAYVGAQLGGAAAASLLLRALFGDAEVLGATLPSIALWKAFLVEVVITAVLAFVITRVALDGGVADIAAAAAIGGAVLLGSLAGGPLTGGSMNPARSFGPALAAWQWSDQWLYWLAPAVGALIGARISFVIQQPPGPAGE
jgi:aquaporin NIP